MSHPDNGLLKKQEAINWPSVQRRPSPITTQRWVGSVSTPTTRWTTAGPNGSIPTTSSTTVEKGGTSLKRTMTALLILVSLLLVIDVAVLAQEPAATPTLATGELAMTQEAKVSDNWSSSGCLTALLPALVVLLKLFH